MFMNSLSIQNHVVFDNKEKVLFIYVQKKNAVSVLDTLSPVHR